MRESKNRKNTAEDVVLSTRVPRKLQKRLAVAAKRNGRTVGSEIVQRLLVSLAAKPQKQLEAAE